VGKVWRRDLQGRGKEITSYDKFLDRKEKFKLITRGGEREVVAARAGDSHGKSRLFCRRGAAGMRLRTAQAALSRILPDITLNRTVRYFTLRRDADGPEKWMGLNRHWSTQAEVGGAAARSAGSRVSPRQGEQPAVQDVLSAIEACDKY
jgi:hypothetical protein